MFCIPEIKMIKIRARFLLLFIFSAAFYSITSTVTSMTSSPPAIDASFTVKLMAHNPSALSQRFANATIHIYHPTGIGRTAVPIGKVTTPDSDVPGQAKSREITLRTTISSSENPYLQACASDIASNNPCRLLFIGTLQPSTWIFALNKIPVEFYADVVRGPSSDKGTITLL